ncbi:MAG: hypothetical protein K2H35_02905 [Muribaculaceae bacterium]|nr:hypothetical protein [Muribaculaceae bacterium]MDE6558363.1 hypothetical protein [Muribaculaceae bacterium]
MKRLINLILFVIIVCFSSNATALFPFFVDIAPNFEDGTTDELEAMGVECAAYHSTRPGILTSTFTQVEEFFKDTLPAEVTRIEKKVGDNLLVAYISEPRKNDTMSTSSYRFTIYVIRHPDDSFVAAYCEEEIE